MQEKQIVVMTADDANAQADNILYALQTNQKRERTVL